MPNITLSIEESLLEAGRRYAQEHQTTLNALVRELLTQTVTRKSKRGLDELFDLMDRAKGNSKGWKWNREEIYDG